MKRLSEKNRTLLAAAMVAAAVLPLIAVPSDGCGLAEFFALLIGSKAAAFGLIFGAQWLLFGKKEKERETNNKRIQL